MATHLNPYARALNCLVAVALLLSSSALAQSDGKKEEKKKVEPFKIKRLTQGMGLYALGSVSPDKRSVLVIGKKPERSPNLYVMDLTDFSIRPPLTDLQWGVADPRWSPDGTVVAFAGFNETTSFSDLYAIDIKTGKMRRLTSTNFTDKEPAFTPDGKRVLYTTDESPLPDAAFGILHVASVPLSGGKSEYFTEDEASSIQPGISADGKGVLLVKIDDNSGRHSLWQYGPDGKPQRNLTERKFARIRRYVLNAADGSIVLWANEEPEQQDSIYILDSKTGQVKPLPDEDLPKLSPALSPDGKLIAFIAPTSTGSHLFLFDNSTGQIHQLTYKGRNTHSPVFIANDQILFGSDRENESEIYLLNLSMPAEEEKKKK